MGTVIITRKGQTTIPQQLREKYGLKEGTKLDVLDTGDGVLLKKAISTRDLIGTSKRTISELSKHLDEIRREDA
ncbi:MAG: AbrB/MazE/SpoVT family DNA-binding domain-containing protein [Candidatus Bathyarchaeia archaeon]